MKQPPVDLGIDLRRALSWRPAVLRFKATDEAYFWRACGPARLRQFLVSGGVALIIYNLFLLTDRLMIPDVMGEAIWVRVFGLTPFALGFLVAGIFFRDFVLRLPHWVTESLATLTGVFAAISLAWLLLQSNSPCASLYTSGLVPIIIYGNLVQRFRFWYALFFSMLVVLIGVFCAMVKADMPHPYAVYDAPLVLLVSLIAIYTLVMNYRFELEERRRFQWSERARALHQDLAASQVQLEALSRLDPLTGVPNRRHFDDYAQTQWRAMQAQGGALALLLMDVDQFKAFNDRYGHPAGDQCLRHVAQALQQRLPETAGCLARWGGEEFIVALPSMDATQAMSMALDLCQTVRALGLRHESSSVAPCVTISVGVAVAPAGQLAGGVDQLVAAADVALYRAKHEGRNRCVLGVTGLN